MREHLKEVGYGRKDIFVFMIFNHHLSYEEMRTKLDACRRWKVRVIDCRFALLTRRSITTCLGPSRKRERITTSTPLGPTCRYDAARPYDTRILPSCLTCLTAEMCQAVKDGRYDLPKATGCLSMTAKRLLVWVLRMTGAAMLCALVFVFCPFGWMQAIHARIGMGELAYTPLLNYLTRTLSGMYASQGAVILFISLDVERYRGLIRLLAWLTILGGATVTALDATLRLPLFWTVTEGPFTVALGVVLILLLARMPKGDSGKP